jgi:signal peptidase I
MTDRWLAGGRTWVRRALDLLLLALVGISLFGIVLGRIVPLAGGATFVVAGGSMDPTIPLGAAVVVEPVAARELAVGDIVSLRSGPQHAVFTHRIVRLADRGGEVWIETQGDANAAPDPSISPAGAVIGRVVVSIPYAGYLVALLSIPSGVLFIVSFGLVLLMSAWALDRDPLDERRERDALDLEPDERDREPSPQPVG